MQEKTGHVTEPWHSFAEDVQEFHTSLLGVVVRTSPPKPMYSLIDYVVSGRRKSWVES
jgi:hypothetical protein